MPSIHPTAIVSPMADLAEDVTIEAYAIIEGRVQIGPGSIIRHHSVIYGTTVLGANCRIGPGAYVGMDPQHLSYKGDETRLVVGDGVTVREGASIHRAFKAGEENATRVGSRVFMMANSHIAHDCRVDDDVIFANSVAIGGHVQVGARAFLAGGAVVHQFARVGRLAIISGNEAASRDVPPFAAMRYGGLKGYNAIGCRRSGMSRESIHALRAVFRCMGAHRTTPGAVRAIKQTVPDLPEVREMLEFIATSKRGIQPSLRYALYDRGEDGAES
jgi:UDP-N-acetylglucosamine acyltransferase